MSIQSDSKRFKEIVRGRIKKYLKRYTNYDKWWGKKGKDIVKISIPRIDIPRFRFDHNKKGVGIGDGNKGDVIDTKPKNGNQKAGNVEGDHTIETDVSIDTLAEILGEELELPYLDLNKKKRILEEKTKYNTVSRTGPESLRHNKRTFLEALKRSVASGTYDPKKPIIIPVAKDKRYKSCTKKVESTLSAAIIYILDVSGSVGEVQKALARSTGFWINAWISKNYKGVENRWIIHDTQAREVDEHGFFHTRESGGTIISTAYKLTEEIIHSDYPVKNWNIYIFHFSDGDNWSSNDSEEALEIIQRLYDRVNLIGYGQVTSNYGSGQFYEELEKHTAKLPKIRKAKIDNNAEVLDAIKVFFSKGL